MGAVEAFDPASCARRREVGCLRMKLLRLFADDNGESHFEDVEMPFEEADDYFENTPPVWHPFSGQGVWKCR